jgi:FK506-binding protein 4/5
MCNYFFVAVYIFLLRFIQQNFDIPAVDSMKDDFDFAGAGDNPILKVGEKKEIGKQGLKKKLLKEGEGWDAHDVGDTYVLSSLI